MTKRKQYDIYYNLHNGKWSIREVGSNLIVGHAAALTIESVTPIVREGGRQRVIKEKRKNVHAFLRGSIRNLQGFESYKGRRKPTQPRRPKLSVKPADTLVYNPYKGPTFFNVSKGEEFVYADIVRLSSDRSVHQLL